MKFAAILPITISASILAIEVQGAPHPGNDNEDHHEDDNKKWDNSDGNWKPKPTSWEPSSIWKPEPTWSPEPTTWGPPPPPLTWSPPPPPPKEDCWNQMNYWGNYEQECKPYYQCLSSCKKDDSDPRNKCKEKYSCENCNDDQHYYCKEC
ncbi:hypothetical protein BZG36_01874 [Bifiguratus adelaidae]|uniref:ShKT domain-containing protein n=1 Tax=Bifiguratus adelaidae TaxID=1938954 RepID=A0A261Y2G9_9FUNG|nr:hypothetical protein BZG36_01874 [Bifiguratus adelaidae]